MESPAEISSAPEANPGLPPIQWDNPAFGALYEEHSQAIFYLALRLTGNPTQAQDATHDVFLKAYRKLTTFRGDSNIRTWLYRITVNHCQNMLQSWHARHMFNNADEAIWETAPTLGDDPLQVLEIKELGERIQRTLSTMSEEYRLLLLLVADEQLTYEQVGEITGQTADAVRGKLHRARKAFTVAFKKTE
ncbi:MAG: RNA polymerase sigma factor [Verrucomicrobiota bacterium]|nr:RNA polymerase sigma factor [Verrucomicrobiota bacterium]